jgi:hypothetical protein
MTCYNVCKRDYVALQSSEHEFPPPVYQNHLLDSYPTHSTLKFRGFLFRFLASYIRKTPLLDPSHRYAYDAYASKDSHSPKQSTAENISLRYSSASSIMLL